MSSYLLYSGLGLTALVWSLVIVPKWSASAERRGGRWHLEAILLACGPLTACLIAMYPRDAGAAFTGPFPVANRNLGYLTLGLVVWALLQGLKEPRKHARPVIAAVAFFYLALLLSVFGGVVPSDIPEQYWITPLAVLAFLVDGRYTFDWLLWISRLTLRIMMALSLAAMSLPKVGFNYDEARTVFDIPRLQGITEHPNTLAALAVIGLLLEMSARSRLVWKLLFVAAIVLAQSSTAYIMVALGALLVTTWASKLIRSLILPAAFAAGIIALLDFGIVQSAVASVLPETSGTLNGRTKIWEAALFGFQQSPVFGYGPAFLSEDYRAMYLPNFPAAAHAHNQWYQSLGGTGIVGGLSLLVLVTVLVVFALKSWRATSGITVAILAAMVIRSFAETPLRPTGVGVSTYLIVLTLSIIATAPRTKDDPVEARADELPQAKQLAIHSR